MEIKDRTIGITEIKCNQCGQVKSADNYYIFISKHKGNLNYKLYRKICKPCQVIRHREYMRNYYIANKETYQKNGAKWHQENKQRLWKKKSERIKNDPVFCIQEKLRIQMKKVVRAKSDNNKKHTINILGCTGKYAYDYLVTMGYDETKHVIDHIIPLSFFDFTNPDHQRVCFNYRNLQPLERIANIQKSDHLPGGWKEKLKEICNALNIKTWTLK